ncbi:MAG: alpha-2-macroglobulin family protein, partial [Chthoniobacterales bacterium]
MVSADQIGKAAAISPLVFQPPVDGSFTWLSTRSGSFAPKGVLPIGTRFQIAIAPAFKDAAGRPIGTKFHETAETPPLRVKGAYQIGGRDSDNATVLPRFLVLFNANVNADTAAKFIRYEDAARNRVAARVEQVKNTDERDRSFPKWESDDRSLGAWTAQSEALEEEEPATDSEDDEDNALKVKKPAPARGNLLFVAPVKPLPPGKDWRLVLDAGVPAAEWKVVLTAPKQIAIGHILSFAPKSISAEANRVAGRRILIEFPKPLADDVNSETIGKWIKLQPPPANLRATVEGANVTLRADFSLGTRYRVTVAAGLQAQEPTQTAATTTQEISFEKLDSRLYFQDFAAHQYARGSRQVRLVSVNVPRVRVIARLFTGPAVAAAVKAFDKYEENPGDDPDEFYTRVPVEALPGQVIWQKDFAPGGGVDAQQTITLNWDEVVGANRTGTVLFTAESIDPVTKAKKRVGTQTLLQLTDIGATWKRDADAVALHLFSLASGKALTNAKLQLLGNEAEQLAEATTDEHGNATLPQMDPSRWVFAQTADDAHLIGLFSGDNDIPLYRLGVTEEGTSDDQEGRYARTIFLFTERGVYKPGDTLHLKGYAQDPRADEPRIPAGKEVTLTITDAKERQIYTSRVVLSEFGSFDADVTLPNGSLGKYSIGAVGEKGEGLGGSCYFQVQEYKPNAFEILVPKPPETFGDTQLNLPITAKYYMGKPLSKAKLTWSLVARDQPFTPEGLAEFVFCNGIYDFRLNRALDRLSQFNAQGNIAVDENGVGTVATALPVNPKAPQPRAAKLLCEVTDINQQTVSASRDLVQQASEFYFGFRRFDGVLKQGAPLPIELIGVRPDGKPLDQPTRATVRLSRINWQTNRLAAAGNTSDFESKANLHLEWERELETAPGLAANRKPNPASLEKAVAGKPGEYLLEASGKDSLGHNVLTSLVFEVSGEAETDWNYRNPYVIELVADKDSYEPGQTATLMMKTPISGDALVSVERDRVLRSFLVPLSGNAPSVQVPITDADGPNVFVSVMILRGADESPRKVKTPEYRIGYANLKIERPKDKLAISVKPISPGARPGEKVQLDAELRDSGGQPAADAEVTLYAVDEGVLSLTGYETPDPLAFFNQPRGLGVTTALTLPTLLKEDLAESDFANKGYLVGDGKGGPALLDGLRTNFIACAFWNATLRSDAQGRVHAEFSAPDSLTRYRIIAVAVTKQGAFGAAQSAFEINKPIMIESAMPAFANVGDKIIMRAVAHNTTDTGGRAEIELRLDSTARAGTARQLIDLPANATRAIDIPIEVVTPGAAKWSWSIR